MPNQLLADTEDAYHVQQDGGGIITVPKAGLSADTHAQIQSYPPAAGGGTMPSTPMADAQGVPPAIAAPSLPAEAPPPTQVASNIPITTPNADPPVGGAQPQVPMSQPGPGGFIQRVEDQRADNAHNYGVGMSQMRRATRQGEVAAANLVAAEQAKAKAEQQGLADVAAYQQKQNAMIANHNYNTEQKLQSAKNAISESEAQVAKMQVDPNRYWADKGTATKIGAAIAIGMTAFGNSLNRVSGNAALDIINSAVDADIKQQMDAREQAKGHTQHLRDMYSMTKTEGQDKYVQMVAAKNMGLEAVKTKVEQYISATSDPIIIAKGQKMISDLTAKQAEYTMSATDKMAAAEARSLSLEMAAENNALDYQSRLAAAAAKGKEALTLPGLQGAAKTPEMYKKATEVESAYQNIIPMIHELRKMREEGGPDIFRGENAARAQSLATAIQLALKDQKGLGVLAGPDMDLLRKMQPDDPTMFGQVLTRLDTLERQVHNETRTTLRTLGFSNREQAYDPRFHVDGFVPGDAGSENLPTPTSNKRNLDAEAKAARSEPALAQMGSSDMAPGGFFPMGGR